MSSELEFESIPVTKPGQSPEVEQLGKGDPNERIYSVPPLYLGQYVHEIIQAKLRMIHPQGGTQYLHHLDAEHTGLGFAIGTKLEKHVEEVLIPKIEEMTGTSDPNKTTYWFAEIPFQPSVQQIENITTLREDDDVINFVKSLGYENTSEFAKQLITANDPQNFIDKTRAQLSKHDSSLSEKVLTFLESIQTYCYFDLTHARKIKSGERFDLDEIPQRFKRIIASAAARTDLFSLSIDKQDEQSLDVLDWFNSFIEGRYFGKRPLHDLSTYSADDSNKMYQLLESIRTGRISFNIVEVKTQFSKADFKKDPIDDQYRDVAHTLWSMYQLVSSIYRLDNGVSADDISWRNSVLQSMLAENDEDKITHLRRAIRNLRGFISTYDVEEELLPQYKRKNKPASSAAKPAETNNNVLLARLYFPIVNVRKFRDQDGKVLTKYSIITNPSTVDQIEVESRVNLLDKFKLTRALAKAGVAIAGQIHKRHKDSSDLTQDNR